MLKAMVNLNHLSWLALHYIFFPYLLSDDRMGAHSCYNHTRSRASTARGRL
jgi:hypothetical protein